MTTSYVKVKVNSTLWNVFADLSVFTLDKEVMTSMIVS